MRARSIPPPPPCRLRATFCDAINACGSARGLLRAVSLLRSAQQSPCSVQHPPGILINPLLRCRLEHAGRRCAARGQIPEPLLRHGRARLAAVPPAPAARRRTRHARLPNHSAQGTLDGASTTPVVVCPTPRIVSASTQMAIRKDRTPCFIASAHSIPAASSPLASTPRSRAS